MISKQDLQEKNVLVISANPEGFERVFIGENCWYAVCLRADRIPYIKYVAAYICRPTSKITHYAEVKNISLFKKSRKYIIYFKENSIQQLINPINIASPTDAIQCIKYTSIGKLTSAKYIKDI